MTQSYSTRRTCRICESPKLTPLFSLGNQYVSDFPEQPDNGGVLCPLELVLCETCTLVQLRHTAPQEFLYSRHYWYRSGITRTMQAALRDITRDVESLVDLSPGNVVLDIGSNDGTLLRTYQTSGITRVGVEPATNLAEEGAEGVDVFINDFWSYKTYSDHVPNHAKVITAIGMFYDLENPGQFIADIAEALDDDGIFIAQLMCLRNMLNVGDVGNFAHEHLEFYSLKSLDFLFGQSGLEIFDIQTNSVNGESYRLYVRLKGSDVKPREGATQRLAHARRVEIGLDRPEFYQDFYFRMERNKKHATDFIKYEVSRGKKVHILGASTKGNCIAQYFCLNGKLIEAASERSPEKWGRYIVGTNIPIKSEWESRKMNPDYYLIMPYAFSAEIMEREKEWKQGGGTFILPLPEFRIV